MAQVIQPRLRVGDVVRVRFGIRNVVAEVLEIRGELADGDRIVRVRLKSGPRPAIEFDAPESTLEISPMRTTTNRTRRHPVRG
jgi:hypothetical protein